MTWDPPKDMDEIHAFTDAKLAEWEAGTRFVWSIFSKEDDAFIGRIETHKCPELPGNTWGLGYWIHPTQQKKGFATEAAREVVRFAFEVQGADEIVTSHVDWNDASGNVMKKLGMKHTGFSEGRTYKHGKPERMAEYALLRGDWNA